MISNLSNLIGWNEISLTLEVWLCGLSCLVVLYHARPHPRDWRFILAILYFAQVCIHRVGEGAMAHDDSRYAFKLLLNLTFLAQLATVVIGPRAAQLIHDARALLAPPATRPRGAHRVGAMPPRKAR